MTWWSNFLNLLRPSTYRRAVSMIEPYAAKALPIVEYIETLKPILGEGDRVSLHTAIERVTFDANEIADLYTRLRQLPISEVCAALAVTMLRSQAPNVGVSVLKAAVELAYLCYRIQQNEVPTQKTDPASNPV